MCQRAHLTGAGGRGAGGCDFKLLTPNPLLATGSGLTAPAVLLPGSLPLCGCCGVGTLGS